MDYFCIQNVNMIDNGRVTLEEPDHHSVHCLLDVGICVRSAFEVLVDSPPGASTTYSRGYRLDDDSKADIISLARSVGSCSTCNNGYDNSMLGSGFKAVMKVRNNMMALGLLILKNLRGFSFYNFQGHGIGYEPE